MGEPSAPPADAPPPPKGRAGKWVLRIGIGLAAVLLAAYLVRNAVARSAAEIQAEKAGGQQ